MTGRLAAARSLIEGRKRAGGFSQCFQLDVCVMRANRLRIVPHKFLDDCRADSGVFHQTGRGMAEAVERKVVLSPSSVATGAIGLLVVGAWWNEAN